MKSLTARRLAWRLLNQMAGKKVFAQELMNQSSAFRRLDERDRRLCRQLILGTIQHQGEIDYQLAALTKSSRLPKTNTLNLLRLGVYQLIFLNKIPSHAAVDETVGLAKQELSRSVAGFMNAVLRNFLRQGPHPLPDKQHDPAGYYLAAFSFPAWLSKMWCDQFGLQAAELMMAAANQQPPLVIRINSLKASETAVMQALTEADIPWQARNLSGALQIGQTQAAIEQWPGYQQGWYYFQDEAAQLIGWLANPQPGEQWLDMCAAPGGKATHLAAIMQNQGRVWAYDIVSKKRALLKANVDRLGCSIVQVIDQLEMTSQLDGVLVDAPCSGLGTLRRHVETKSRLSPKDILRLARQQLALLQRAASLVKPGGTLVYATCTTTEEENEQVVEKFTQQQKEFHLQTAEQWGKKIDASLQHHNTYFKTYPDHPELDGLFAVRWKKMI